MSTRKKRGGRGGVTGDAWEQARALCRLDARQVEMAKELGMNPKKLPGLRPSPSQKWKRPVGAFIEECYRERFGGRESTGEERPNRPRAAVSGPARPASPKHSEEELWARAQLESLVAYFANLSDDLGAWLARDAVLLDVPAQLAEELHALADDLREGRSVPQMPSLEEPEFRDREPERDRVRERSVFDDDDIPF